MTSNEQPPTNQPLTSKTKKCPYCAEEIQDEAVVCRFCQFNLKTGMPVNAVFPTVNNTPLRTQVAKKQTVSLPNAQGKGWWLRWLWPKIVDQNSVEKAILYGVWGAIIVACMFGWGVIETLAGRFGGKNLHFFSNGFITLLFILIAFRIKRKSILLGIVGLGMLFFESIYESGLLWKIGLDDGSMAVFILAWFGILATMFLNALRGLYVNCRLKSETSEAEKAGEEPKVKWALSILYLIIFIPIYLVSVVFMALFGADALHVASMIGALICLIGCGKAVARVFETNYFDKNSKVKIAVRLILIAAILCLNLVIVDEHVLTEIIKS